MTDHLDSAPLLASFNRIVIGHDGEDFVLGRPDLGIFVAVPEPGAVFAEALRAGASLEHATAQASAAAGEEVDGQDFLDGLASAGLLQRSVTQTRQGTGREVRWTEGVSPRVAACFVGPVAWSGYAAAAVFVVTVLALFPALRPRFEQVWWLPDPVSSMLLLIPVSLVLGALHEAWHWLAGRALGVPAVFRVSYRGVFLVFETDLTQIVIVPRRRRYAAFLAGMAFDVTVLAIVLALRLADRAVLIALPGWFTRFLAAVALGQFFRVVWQVCAVVRRSDMYAVLANALKCHDLYRATRLTTKDRLWRLREDERSELAAIDDHDRRVAQWFGVAYLAGGVAMLWFVLEFALPGIVGILSWVGVNLAHPAISTWAFWSSLFVAVYVVVRWLLPPLLAARERRLRQAGALR